MLCTRFSHIPCAIQHKASTGVVAAAPTVAPQRRSPSVVAKVAHTTEAYVPQRNYLDGEPDYVWRNGKPDYTAVNKTYLAGKTRNWAADSLESLVESVVKTLEMEISHKVCV
jgi:hypothetical protein